VIALLFDTPNRSAAARVDMPPVQVHRIRLCHPMLASQPSHTLESQLNPRRNPLIESDPCHRALDGETGSVDRLVENEGRTDTIASQCCDESHRFPVTIRYIGLQSLPDRRLTAQRPHIGFCPGLIDKVLTK
jgi:hypothetical protein